VRRKLFQGPCLIVMYVSVQSKKSFILSKESYALSKEPHIRPTEVNAVPNQNMCKHMILQDPKRALYSLKEPYIQSTEASTRPILDMYIYDIKYTHNTYTLYSMNIYISQYIS